MREMFILIAHLLVTLAKLARPGGFRVVAAESLAVKHQLLIMKRSRQRAPNLTSWDRLTLGFCALFVSRERLSKMAVILKASTLLQFHQALVKRKYYLPFDEWTGVFASERLTGALLDRVCGEVEAVEALDRWELRLLDPALDGPPFPVDHLLFAAFGIVRQASTDPQKDESLTLKTGSHSLGSGFETAYPPPNLLPEVGRPAKLPILG